MISGKWIGAAVLAACMGVGCAWCDEVPAPGGAVVQSGEGLAGLEQFSQGSQALYGKLAGSLVHVRVDPTYMTVFTPAQRREFLEWMRGQNAEASKDGAGAQDGAATTGEAPRRGAAATMAAGRVGVPAMFRRYIDLKMKDPATDPALLGRLRQAVARLQQPVGELMAVVIDSQGDALVLGGWVREGAPLFVRVTVPDGREMNARYIGGHPGRGLAIVRLESPGAAAPLAIAESGPAAGELLMCMTANTGGLGWIAAPVGYGKKAGEESRFAVFGGENHGPTFLFNTKGQLAAVGFDRYALPMEVVRNDVKWIVQNRRDVAPRQLGVKYAPVPLTLRQSVRVLANRPAVVVEDVAAGSPAERAGLKKDDIVLTIDRRPIWQMAQIQWDMATQVDSVPIGIVRGERELTLDMPLGE